MPPIPRPPWLCTAIVATALAAALPAAAQQRVGVSSAVNPATTGEPPGQTARQLVVGENIVFNEHIATGPDGQTQILFVDESAMSIGPNSDMTIDEFVYNPKTGTGSEALSATRGVFRYVGGKLSKAATPVTIKTPVATIGIRGGVFVMDLQQNGHLDVVFLYGKGLTVTGLNGTTETITRPGFGVTVSGKGAVPSSPAAAKTMLASFMSQLDGRSGGNGGSTTVPTDATVTNSGISQTVSGNVVGSIQAAVQSQAATQALIQTQTASAAQPTNLNLNDAASQNQQVIAQAIQNNGAGPTAPAVTGVSGGFTGIGSANSTTGFTGQIIPYSGGTVENGVLVTTVGADQVSIPVVPGTTTTGTGNSNQFGPLNVTSTTNADGTFFYANGSPVNNPGALGVVYGGQPVGQGAYAATGSPQFLAFQVEPDAALQSAVPFVNNANGGGVSQPTVSPLYVAVAPITGFPPQGSQGVAFPKALQASLAINGQGAGQSSVLLVAVGNAFTPISSPVLNGAAEGSYRPNGNSPSTLVNTSFLTGVDGAGNGFYGNTAIEGFVLTPNDCCNPDGTPIQALATATNTQTGASTNYGFVQPVVAIAAPAGVSGPQTTQSLTGFIGGTMTGTQNGVATPYVVTGGSQISTNASTLQIQALLAGTDPFTPGQSGVNNFILSYGTLTPGNTGARQGYINDNLFGALETPGGADSSVNGSAATSASLYLVNANAVPANTLLPAGLCQCQYLQWGYWGGEVDSGSGSAARTDIAHINTWLAGVPTSATDINNLISMSARASYSGNAIGSVINNGASYLASSPFSQSYNFGTQTGTLSISNFDGNSFNGTVAGARGSANFAGSLTGANLTGPATTFGGSAVGAFYGPAAANTGGSFAVHSITGLPYSAAGIFAGKKN